MSVRTYWNSAEQAGAEACFLRANSNAYERLVHAANHAYRKSSVEASLSRISLAANFAAAFHAGRFADGAIENLALDSGAELNGYGNEYTGWEPAVIRSRKRRVLHVATDVSPVGGHSRVLGHWIRHDKNSCHSLAIVNQGNSTVPEWLANGVQCSGGELSILPCGSRDLQKSEWLRDAARRSADLVVLHHASRDVVPTLAFSQRGGPPVAVLNHADHIFWLGSSVADFVINHRTAACEHTATRRFVSDNLVLPVCLDHATRQFARDVARCSLGIPRDQIVLLSIGRPEKYRPSGRYDFVATATAILQRQPRAHVYVVGESLARIKPYLRCVPHDRLHFVGSIDDPVLHRAAADIYLEPFPFGTQTAVLEAALSGIPAVRAYAPLCTFLVTNDDALNELLPTPGSEEEYVEQVVFLANHQMQRLELGTALKERVLVDHVGAGWLDRLAVIYKHADGLKHCPRPIPSLPCMFTEMDIGLSLWHAMRHGELHSVKDVLYHTASIAKWSGDYAEARIFALRNLVHHPFRRAAWRLLAVSVLGRFAKHMRRLQARARTFEPALTGTHRPASRSAVIRSHQTS